MTAVFAFNTVPIKWEDLNDWTFSLSFFAIITSNLNGYCIKIFFIKGSSVVVSRCLCGATAWSVKLPTTSTSRRRRKSSTTVKVLWANGPQKRPRENGGCPNWMTSSEKRQSVPTLLRGTILEMTPWQDRWIWYGIIYDVTQRGRGGWFLCDTST